MTGDVGRAGLYSGPTAPTFTSGQPVKPLLTDMRGGLRINGETDVATYGASSSFVIQANATDIAVLQNAGASGLLRLHRIEASHNQIGTALNFQIFKRGNFSTGGTVITPAPILYDSANALPNGVVRFYTANATTVPGGSTTGIGGATLNGGNRADWIFGSAGSPVVIRPGECVAVTMLTSNTVTAGVTISFRWSEVI
jgi:hypothetical protein